MHLSFSKFSGSGNDFMLVDNRAESFPCSNARLIRKLCHRHDGIGADGLILVEKGEEADFRMRIFNADGIEAEMCGNGTRCLYLYLSDLGFEQEKYTIETMSKLISIARDGDLVRTDMGGATITQWNMELPLEGSQVISLHALDTGVPHVVTFVEDIARCPVEMLGSKIRHHPHFAPKGTNVNFAKVTDHGEVYVRTYERGVEQETLACGTGATATAIAAAKTYQLKSPLSISTRSRDTLEVRFNDSYSHVTLSGPAKKTFEGTVNLQFFD